MPRNFRRFVADEYGETAIAYAAIAAVISIAIIFVFLFPPICHPCCIAEGREARANAPLQLFEYEIVAIVWGDLWGVWVGFGLTAAGTLFGELANF